MKHLATQSTHKFRILLTRFLNETCLTDDKFRELVNKLDKGDITNKIFKEILPDLMETDKSIDTILEEKGLNLSNDENLVEEIVNKVLNENEKMVADYKNGNERIIKALMGLVMKEAHGKINPAVAIVKLQNKLDA